MRILHLQFLLIAAVAFGQSLTPAKAPVPTRKAALRTRTAARKSAPVRPDTPVIVVDGLCEKLSDKSTNSSAAGSLCRTVITRAQFEDLANAVNPAMDEASRRQLAMLYPKLLVMDREFHKRGLEKNPQVQKALAFNRLRAQAEELARNVKTKSEVLPDSEIQEYYKKNKAQYDQVELLRVYIPGELRSGDTGKSDPDAMKKVAADIRDRALRGDDFTALQDDAYKAAKVSGPRPPVKLGPMRLDQVPPNHRSILTLPLGEVSPVLADLPNGYYIYKVVSRGTRPLEEVKGEIATMLGEQNFITSMRKIEQSAAVTLNQSYFPPSTGMSAQMAPTKFGGNVRGTATISPRSGVGGAHR